MAEQKDAKFSVTSWAIGALIIMLLAGLVFVRLVYQTPLATERGAQLKSQQAKFPNSDAQPQPGRFTTEALLKLRKQENADLNSYRWSNSQHSEAKVPIARAIEIYEEQNAE